MKNSDERMNLDAPSKFIVDPNFRV